MDLFNYTSDVSFNLSCDDSQCDKDIKQKIIELKKPNLNYFSQNNKNLKDYIPALKSNHNLSDQETIRNNKSICQDFLLVLKDIEQKEKSQKEYNTK